jgi:hypothetical protein
MKRPRSLTEKTAASEPTARNSCFCIVNQPTGLKSNPKRIGAYYKKGRSDERLAVPVHIADWRHSYVSAALLRL